MLNNLAARLILWLCARFGIVVLAEQRLAMSNDAKTRSERWEQFYSEDGGLSDMIAALRREAFEAAAELPPEDIEKLQYWSMSDRNLRRLDARVRGVIASGKIEARNDDMRERMRATAIRKSVY